LAFFLDLWIGDPPKWPHPVKWIGTLIGQLDKKLNTGRHKRLNGIIMSLIVLLLVFVLTAGITYLAYQLHVIVGIIVETVLISTTIAQKSLREAGMEVFLPLVQGDMTEARLKLSYIVGRDTDQLDESEIVRGTVETVAENTSDGITAPLFWAFIGGAPLAMLYRAINTCDSMVGYRNDKYGEFGWASARLDDVVNWIPSRITGFLMLLGYPSRYHSWKKRWSILWRDAKRHPSPNSGWTEAAVAALLGVQLGGRNVYKGVISHRAEMGEKLVPLKARHIRKTITIMHLASWLFLMLIWLGGWFIVITHSWS
jgi:adenosylcobinamide-phosphate synthase